MSVGRGSWTKSGHSNGSVYYAYFPGRGIDGSESSTSLDHKAVNSAVRAIQTELSKRFNQSLKIDGQFGPATSVAVKLTQNKFALTPDGQVGQSTAKALFRPALTDAAFSAGVSAALLYGQVYHESTFDPGARGYFNPPDSGLVQINLDAFPNITWEQAFDPGYSLPYSAKRLSVAMKKYASKPELQKPCAIASHNSPSSADTWFKNGKAPNASIEDYVVAVLRYSADF